MQVSKKNYKFLKKVLDIWLVEDKISDAKYTELINSLEKRSFDWKKLSKHSFKIAFACIFIAISTILIDPILLSSIFFIFFISDILNLFIFLGAGTGFIFWREKRKIKKPEKIYTNEGLMFISLICFSIFIIVLSKILKVEGNNIKNMLLVTTIIYGLIGYFLYSPIYYFSFLIALSSYFGMQTAYISGYGSYYIAISYPMTFLFLGIILLFVSYHLKNTLRKKELFNLNYIFANLYIFISLWIMSIFGSSNSYFEKSISEIFLWSLIFFIVAIIFSYLGIKNEDNIAKGFGLTFIFINLYTKYFEYFWNILHKSVFFLILGVSFWYIGNHFEKLWNFDFKKNNYVD